MYFVENSIIWILILLVCSFLTSDAYSSALQHDDRSDSDNPVDNHLVKRKTKSSFDGNTNGGHNRSERLNLLRQFVLGDFSSDEQDSDESNTKKSTPHNMRQDRYMNTIRDGKQLIKYPDNQQELFRLSKNGSSSNLSSKPQNVLLGDLNSSKTFSNGGNHMVSRSSFLEKPVGMKISSNVIKDRLRNREMPIKSTKKKYNEMDPWNQSNPQRSKIEMSDDFLVLQFPKLEQTKRSQYPKVIKKLYTNHSRNSMDIGVKNSGQLTISHQQMNRLNTRHHNSKSDRFGKEKVEKIWNDKGPYDSETMLLPSETKTPKTIKKFKRKDYHHSSPKMQKNNAFDKEMQRKSNILRRSHHVSSVTKNGNDKNYSTEGLNKDIVGNAKRNLQITKFETTTKSKKKIEIKHRNSGDSPPEKRFLGSSHDEQINSKFGTDDDDDGDDDDSDDDYGKYDDEDDHKSDDDADADADADIGDDYGDDNDDGDDVDDDMENENGNYEMNDVSSGIKSNDVATVFKNNSRGEKETNKINKHMRDISKEQKVVNDDNKSDNNVDEHNNNSVDFVDYINNRKREKEKDKNDGEETYGNSNAQNFETLKSKHATYGSFKQTKYGNAISVSKEQNDSINTVNNRSQEASETSRVDDKKTLNYELIFKTKVNSEDEMLQLNQSSDFTKLKTVKDGTNGIFKNRSLTLPHQKHNKSSNTDTDRVETLMQTDIEIKPPLSDISTRRTSINRPKNNQNGSLGKTNRNERENQSSLYVFENTKNEKLKRGVQPTVINYLEGAHQNQEKSKESKKYKFPKSLEVNAIKSNLEYWNENRNITRNNHGPITKTRISIDTKYMPASKKKPRIRNRKISMEKFGDEKSQQDVVNSILKGELFDLKISDQVSTNQRENKISKNNESALNHKKNKAKGNFKLEKKHLRKGKHFITKRKHGLKNRIIIEQSMPESGFDLYILRVSPKFKRSNFTASKVKPTEESLRDKRNYTVKQKPNTDHQIQLNEVNNKRGGWIDLVQKILDQPLKSVVNFLRPYIFSKANAGNMTLRDSLSHALAHKNNSGVPQKGSKIRNESKSFKERNSNLQLRINWKISLKNLRSNSTSLHGKGKLGLWEDNKIRNDGMQKNQMKGKRVNETSLKTVLKPSMPIDSGIVAKGRLLLTNRRKNNSILSSDLTKMTMKKAMEHDYRNSNKNDNKPNRIKSLGTLVRKNISFTHSKDVHNLTVNEASSSSGKSMDNPEANGVPPSILSKYSDSVFNRDPVEEDIRVFISDEMLEKEQNVYGKNVKKSLTPRNEINSNNVYYIPLKGKIYKHKSTGSMEDAMVSLSKRSRIINSTTSNRRSTNKYNKTQISLRSSIGRFESWNQFLETNHPTKSIINENVIDHERTAYEKGDNVQEISKTETDNAYPSWDSTSMDLQKNSYQMYSDTDGNSENNERNYLHTGTSPHLAGANIASAQYTFHIRPRTVEPSDVPLRFSKNESSTSYKGIFGNVDNDLQTICINKGKQDFVDVCPNGWSSYKQFCFLVSDGASRWSQIPDICSQWGGKMAMPKSQDVLTFLIGMLTSGKRYYSPYFVGLRKKDEKWEWIDDTPLSQGLRNDQDTDFQSCAVLDEGSLRKMPCEGNAGYICELKIGVEASRILAVGDSLTKGYYNAGNNYHPYGQKLEEFLNKDDHRCFHVEISGKNGEMSSDMVQRFSNYLNTKQRTFNWLVILAGTNDLFLTTSSGDKIADQVIIMHEVAHARGLKSIVVTIPEIFCERTTCTDIKERRKLANKRLRIYAKAGGRNAFLSDVALGLSLHQLSLEDRNAFWEPSGVHMKPKGYDKLAEIIFNDLMESIGAP